MSANGTLNQETARRLRAVHRARKSGSFLVEAGRARREIFLRDGAIVGIRTSVDAERLGELLIRSGRITRQHFEDASVFVRHRWRLGEILAELGVLDRSEIEPAVRRQAIEVCWRALAEPEPRALRQEDYYRAIQLLRRAIHLGDERAETHFLLGEALAKNPRWRQEAERSYRRALEIDPWRRETYVALARLYESAGLSRRAERILEQARERGAAA